jgi:hypothetical protein
VTKSLGDNSRVSPSQLETIIEQPGVVPLIEPTICALAFVLNKNRPNTIVIIFNNDCMKIKFIVK